MTAPRLGTTCDPRSDAFARNSAAQQVLVDELHEKLSVTALGGPEGSRTRHVERGKLLPRDRVDALLDPGSRFLELSPLAADGMYDGLGADTISN